MTIAPAHLPTDPGRLTPASDEQSAREALRRGEPVILLDADGAVLAQPAVAVTAAQLHFAIRHSSGLIHAAMSGSRLDRLRIPDQQVLPGENSGAGFTVAVDAAAGITTGISATDRARTLRVLADQFTVPGDLIRPGHVLPIRCDDSGYDGRWRVWELAVDLVRAAGHPPVAMACRLIGDDGDTLSSVDAARFAHEHRITLAANAYHGTL